jgi:hypothetical protein
MAFTPTTLAITPLLEATFISDMRLIINSNTTLLQTQVEDIINVLEIDLVNKYIGIDTPVNKIFSQDVVVSNSIIFKAGATVGASTIASLTQSAGVSTFTVDNMVLNKSNIATAAGSLVAVPTIVIGTDSSNLTITYPTTSTVADKGLYVGDSTTPIKTRLYGEVEIPKQAITQSYSNSGGSFSPRLLTMNANGTQTYSYAKLLLSKTDPQFIYVDLKFANTYSNYGNPIYLLLHESSTNRPAAGQTFTIIINKIYKSDGSEVDYNLLPAISNTPSAAGINLMNGSIASAPYKRGYINGASWTTPASLTTDELTIAALSTDSAAYAFRFGNINNSTDTVFRPKCSTINLTKSEEGVDNSIYTITSSHNTCMVKN